MANKIKTMFGGLVASALVAGSALGSTNDAVKLDAGYENKPVITKLERVEKPTYVNISVSATNLTERVKYNLYKSNDLKNWEKTGLVYRNSNASADLNEPIRNGYKERDTTTYGSRAFFMLSTRDEDSFSTGSPE